MGTLAPLTPGHPSAHLWVPSCCRPPWGSAGPPAPGPCPWPGSGFLSRAQGVTRGRGVVPPPPAAPHSGSGPAGTPIPHTSLSSQPLQGEQPTHLPCSLAVSTRPPSWPNGTLQAPTCAHHAGLGSRVGGANLILAPHPHPRPSHGFLRLQSPTFWDLGGPPSLVQASQGGQSCTVGW